jgi:UDP-N-acetylglucosamine transferase subunit ALG13
MIFVTVGTDTHAFDRLLKEIDKLVGEGKIKEKVMAQIGSSTYKPQNYEYFTFESSERLESLLNDSSLIISHAGIGNIISALSRLKPLVLVPRLATFGEHTDDHQMEIAEQLDREGRAVCVKDIALLSDAIEKARKLESNKTPRNKRIPEMVEGFISGLENQ